ncbi:hypothetical protein N9B65_02885 [Akkermansiaceae bacterium]|nr:hypothetical protein [Akkermansiaceae bacterium]MDB4465145.1 hypothetical protein [Akkermansiaceae bacterium]MDB4466197.1 hypothetical protein [bacterium]
MKSLLSVTLFFCVLQSCVQHAGGEPDPPDPSYVQFITPWQPGVGMGLYVRVDKDGEPHPVQENISNFTTIARGQFAEKGIPANAIAAASFLEMGDPKADLQAVYAIRQDDDIHVFRGYFVPGFGGPVEWERVKIR